MIQYIYFVKCPECEDEPFDFFDEAKGYALGCLSKKPIITQTEVNRNDFGECTDSADLGTVWSWEDEVNVSNDEPAVSVFTKGDFAKYNPDHDNEFSSLDNSLDDIPDNFRKPVPADMTIKDLVEEMEENEDTVECTWCNELFDKSECRYEVDLGYLCSRCEAAIKSRGETLTFRENNYWDFLDEDAPLKEAFNFQEPVELYYDSLTTTVYGNQRDADDWDEEEYTSDYSYMVTKDDISTTIWENFITEEDVADVPGGLEALEDDEAWKKFLEVHFDDLFEKYYDKLLKHYENDAQEAFDSGTSWDDYQSAEAGNHADYEYETWRDEQFDESVKSRSMLEELEDADAYSKRLSTCPECGESSFDRSTLICINCGSDLN